MVGVALLILSAKHHKNMIIQTTIIKFWDSILLLEYFNIGGVTIFYRIWSAILKSVAWSVKMDSES